jgi:hypothetical protein
MRRNRVQILGETVYKHEERQGTDMGRDSVQT